MKKRCFITLILIFCMSFTSFAAQNVEAATTNAADIAIKLISDNKIIDTETVTVNNRTLIPVRKLLESVGATVEWADSAQRVDLTRNGKKISLHIGNNILNTPDGSKEMDAAPILHNGNTTYAPIRAIAEEFGLSVDWDEATKTILITSPDGCPYVDFYDGMTVKQALETIDISPEEFREKTGLDYEAYKDKLYVQADNAVPVIIVAQSNSMTFADMKELCEFDDSVKESTAWGEAVGSMTMESYINTFLNPADYGMSAQDVLEQIRMAYGLGNEYTLATKFRYVRVLIDTVDYENSKTESVEPKPQSDIVIPDIMKGKMDLDFIYKLIDKVGNGKLKVDYYILPPGVVTALSHVEDGIWHGYPYNVAAGYENTFTYTGVKVITVDGAPADEIMQFGNALIDALNANGYTFAKVDEEGAAHYVKGKAEFMIQYDENKIVYISAATDLMSCCATGGN